MFDGDRDPSSNPHAVKADRRKAGCGGFLMSVPKRGRELAGRLPRCSPPAWSQSPQSGRS